MLTFVVRLRMSKKIDSLLVWSTSNAPLNNFCAKENDKITSLAKKKKKKSPTKFSVYLCYTFLYKYFKFIVCSLIIDFFLFIIID